MKKDLEQIFEEAKKIKLPGHEKARVRELMLFYVKRSGAETEVDLPIQAVEYGFWQTFFSKGSKAYVWSPVFAILVLFFGVGISVAAQKAVPGDVLYPVKIASEDARSFFVFSAEAGADLEAELAIRRLDEAEKLAKKGRITEKVIQELQVKFLDHALKSKNKIAELRDKNKLSVAADLNARFESGLVAHKEALAKVASDENSLKEVQKIISDVKLILSNVKLARTEMKNNISGDRNLAKKNAEGIVQAAGNKIEEVNRIIKRSKDNLDPRSSKKLEKVLEDAKWDFASGKASLEAGDYSKAFSLSQTAILKAEDPKQKIQIQNELSLDLSLTATSTPENASSTDSGLDDHEDGADKSDITVGGEVLGTGTGTPAESEKPNMSTSSESETKVTE
ncbi:hypothetical protein HYW53_02900 [Candidatus Giovannonibacteria bacterium]|nr:hypothetical protein [Candidatus Giovannonibacteria bacterium]